MSKNPFDRPGTKVYLLAEMFYAGVSRSDTFLQVAREVEIQRHPWIYAENVKGSGRVARPIHDRDVRDSGKSQLQLLKDDINRVFNRLERDEKRGLGGSVPMPEPTPDVPEVKPDEIKPEVKPEVKPIKSSTAHKRNEKQWFYDEWLRLRRWIDEVATATGDPAIDQLESNRTLIDANKLIDVGISAKLLRYVMVMHWPRAALDMAGVEVIDFREHSEKIDDGFHYLSGYILKLIEAKVNIMIIGPSGTGKSHVLRQVAEYLDMPYGETAINDGATRGDLLGRWVGLDKFVSSQACDIYAGGGIHNYEEIDAADERMLIVMNGALASNVMFNSSNGEKYVKHENSIAASTANTFGLGADAKFTGRNKLDHATLDRFRMGRCLYLLDEELARSFIIHD